MKFIVNREEFSKTLEMLNKITNPKYNPLIGCVLINTKGNTIRMTAYNLELGATTKILSASFDNEDGEICIDSNVLLSSVNKIKADEVSIETVEGNKLRIAGVNTKREYVVSYLDSQQYPEIPKEENGTAFDISAETIGKAIAAVTYAVDEGENTKFPGYCIDIYDNKMTVYGLNGYMFAIYEADIEYQGERITTFVPKESGKFLLSLVNKSNSESFKMIISDKHIQFSNEEYDMFSRTLCHDVFDYEKLIGKCTTSVIAKSQDLYDIIDGCLPIVTNALKEPIKLEVSAENNSIKCINHTYLGKTEDTYTPEKIEGDNLEIGFNAKLLLETIKNIDSENIILQFNGSVSPLIIRNMDFEGNWAVALPMRLKN